MSGFNSPNYTQTPNELFDRYLIELSGAELKIVLVLIRQTFGYHRAGATVEMSTDELVNRTGMSKNSILKAGDNISHIVKRTVVGRGRTRKTHWKLLINYLEETDEKDRIVKPIAAMNGAENEPIDEKIGAKTAPKEQDIGAKIAPNIGAKTEPKNEKIGAEIAPPNKKQRKQKAKKENSKKQQQPDQGSDPLNEPDAGQQSDAVAAAFSEIQVIHDESVKSILKSWPDIEPADILAWGRYRSSANVNRNGNHLGVGYLVSEMKKQHRAPAECYWSADLEDLLYELNPLDDVDEGGAAASPPPPPLVSTIDDDDLAADWWNQLMFAMSTSLDAVQYQHFLGDAALYDASDNTFTVLAPDEKRREWLELRLNGKLAKRLEHIAGRPIVLRYITPEEVAS